MKHPDYALTVTANMIEDLRADVPSFSGWWHHPLLHNAIFHDTAKETIIEFPNSTSKVMFLLRFGNGT